MSNVGYEQILSVLEPAELEDAPEDLSLLEL